MPTSYITNLSAKHGVSIRKLEKEWEDAKNTVLANKNKGKKGRPKSAKTAFENKDWATTTMIFKNKIRKKYAINEDIEDIQMGFSDMMKDTLTLKEQESRQPVITIIESKPLIKWIKKATGKDITNVTIEDYIISEETNSEFALREMEEKLKKTTDTEEKKKIKKQIEILKKAAKRERKRLEANDIED